MRDKTDRKKQSREMGSRKSGADKTVHRRERNAHGKEEQKERHLKQGAMGEKVKGRLAVFPIVWFPT
jgi:hypothetical protein